MFKTIILGTLLACANAYYNHGPGFPHHYYYGNYGPVPAAPVGPLYNHIPGVPAYVPKTVAQPIVNPFPVASRPGLHAHHLGHGFYHQQAAGAHSLSATPAPTPSYVPPPVVVPPSVTYNNNVVPPSVQNLNQAAPVPANYQHAVNYQHRAYAPVYSHAHMYNHAHYGW